MATIDPEGVVEIVAADGVAWLGECADTIDLLYLDADGRGGKGKSIYLDMIDAARHVLRPGSLVLAHNSVNSANDLTDYFARVHDGTDFRESVNVVVDTQGLEVSVV